MNLSIPKNRTYKEQLSDNLHFKMMEVKGGAFMFGKTEESAGHEVTLSDYYMAKYPVTVAEYLHFVSETNTNHPEWLEEGSDSNIYTGRDNYYQRFGETLMGPQYPIIGISWHNAKAYCVWLSQKTAKNYRLPTETEWEYAARGGREGLGFPFAGSYKLKEVGWFLQNSHGETKPVGLKLPNELGLHDMSGNVREWCLDHYQSERRLIPQDGSPWLDAEKKANSNAARVVRGGSWNSYGNNCRVSSRSNYLALNRYFNIGFRVVRY